MELHRCASAASDHSESVTGSHHEQHCSQMPQQLVFNATSQGHPHHLSGYNHMPPQQSRMVVPQQQYISAEPDMRYGQAQAKQTPSDLPTVCSALTGEVSLHGQLMSSVLTYSETKSHQRHSSSHEPAAAAYGNISGPVMSMPGQVFHSPNAVHQNVEGMVVMGHLPSGDGHVPHGGYYPMPHHGQRMQNSGQISWQSQRQYMSPGGQGKVPGQVYVSGAQVRFNSRMPVSFRAQHPHYAVSQEYGDVYCQQYHPMYGELNAGSPRGTFRPQQHCVGPNGQRIMFARPAMHTPHHQPHMPGDGKFVYYTPTGIGASQQLSPSWSGSAPVMRSGIPVGYGNQPAWQQPVAVAYGGPLPGQRMSGYHMSPEPRINPELCDNLGGARQHSSPSHSFSPGLVRCYRPSSSQGVHAGMVNVDDKYIGTCRVPADGNPNGTPASQEYVSPIVTSTNVGTAAVCTTVPNISSKDNSVVTPTTTHSHPLEHLPDGRTSVPHNSCVIGTAAASLSSYNQPSYYVHETNMNSSWSVVSCTGEYYSYNAASGYTQDQHTGRHISPYNCYALHPRVPYPGIPRYCMTRCGHPYQSRAEGMEWQGQVAEHPLHECRNVLPDDVASQHHLEQESLTPVAVTTSSEPSRVTAAVDISSSAFSASAPVPSWKVDKQTLADTDKVLVARTLPLQSTASNAGSRVPFSGSAYPLKDNNAACSPTATSWNCCAISQVVATATSTVLTLPGSPMDSVHMVSPKDTETPPANKDLLLVQEKNIENVVAVPPPETESQNSLQVTCTALSSTSKSSKGPKRSGSRKATTKTKKKKTSLPLYTDEVCGSSAVVTCADAVKCNAIESVCFSSSISHMVSPLMIMPGTGSVDMCHVKSSDSEQAAVVVPYGWRRNVNSGAVVYYRLHSLILLLLIVV